MDPKTNPIAEALRVFFSPGDVFEIRLLEAETTEYRLPHNETGYFDYDNAETAAHAIAGVRSYMGAYVTANPVTPSLLARAANRIRQAKKGESTSDNHILSRRWFLIDCDAVRPAGISSSDSEHALALARARQIKEYLTSIGFSLPLLCDSGNGAQLMYRIDLPADDNNLLHRCLASLDHRFSDASVNIDMTVFNPSRIWRLPGTWNRKGDNMPERPHRMASLLELPEQLNIVDTALLEALAAEVQDIPGKPQRINAPAYSGPEPDINAIAGPPPPDRECFNLDNWIARHCSDIQGPEQWQGGRKWIFDICPFNSEHTNRSAVITEQPGGAIGFKCHHNGCKCNDWPALRQMKEGPRPLQHKTITHTPASTASASTPQPAPAPKLIDKFAHSDPGQLPPELLIMPGFVADVMEYTLRTAPYPNRVLAFTGALALLSYLAGRNVRDAMNNMPNLYLIALANSGTGKDHPRKVNVEIAYRAGLASGIGDAFASGEGIEDSMYLNNKMLFQTDEIDGLLNTINKAKDGRNEMIMNVLLKMYSSANSIYPLRKKAGRDGKKKEGDSVIDKPSLTLFGTAVPKYLYESLNGRMLDNGFFARSIILEAGIRGKGQNIDYEPIPDSIIDSAKAVAEEFYGVGDASSGNLFNEHPTPRLIPATAEAAAKCEALRDYADTEYQRQQRRGDETAMAIWARVYEKSRKLAMLYAISHNIQAPEVTAEAVDWAQRFIEYQTRRMLFMAESYVSDNPFHAECLKVKRKMQAGKISHKNLLRSMHLKAQDFESIMKYLEDAGEVALTYECENTTGKMGKFYELTK
ncbi:MAG: DUF3987 domain-containing protein [Lentisphaerota bacterium]